MRAAAAAAAAACACAACCSAFDDDDVVVVVMPLGLPPDVESSEGAGDNVTELVCEMRWERLGKVSEAEELSNGQWEPKGEGEVGVMRPGGRGVSGEEGKEEDASRNSIWRMLWITSPAPAQRSARSFFERKHSALPKQ